MWSMGPLHRISMVLHIEGFGCFGVDFSQNGDFFFVFFLVAYPLLPIAERCERSSGAVYAFVPSWLKVLE